MPRQRARKTVSSDDSPHKSIIVPNTRRAPKPKGRQPNTSRRASPKKRTTHDDEELFEEEEVTVEMPGRQIVVHTRQQMEPRRPNQRLTGSSPDKRRRGGQAAIAPVLKAPKTNARKTIRLSPKKKKQPVKRQQIVIHEEFDDDFDDLDMQPHSSLDYMGADEGETEFIEIQEPDAPPVLSSLSADSKSIPKLSRLIPSRPLSSQSDYGIPLEDDELEDPDPFVPTQYPQLQGITVTGNAPAVEAPSRVFMKLKAPEIKRTRYKGNASSHDYMEYLDEHYSPQLHVGGRGRFGVIGHGPAPTPVIIDRPEDFSYLPPQVVSDHCYGKAAPQSQVVEGFGRGRLPPAHLLPTAMVSRRTPLIRQYKRSPSPPSYRHPAAFVVADTGLDYGMEVAFEEHTSGGLGGGMLGHGKAPMLGVDKLPANILEETDEPELGEASIDIQ